MKIRVIIPFRLREGADPRRAANLAIVQAWWYVHGYDPQIVSDGLSGDAQFNRHRAYNRAVDRFPETEVFIFTEADMLVHPSQIKIAVRRAVAEPGLVVPFTQYRYLSDGATAALRDWYNDKPEQVIADSWSSEVDHPLSVFTIKPESVMDNGRSIGAINVVSRETLEMTGGFTEATSGNWYDDNIIEEGFAFLTGNPTRYVEGPAVHMYHLPGHKGAHLSEADKDATARNRRLLQNLRTHVKANAPKSQEAVRNFMAVRVTP